MKVHCTFKNYFLTIETMGQFFGLWLMNWNSIFVIFCIFYALKTEYLKSIFFLKMGLYNFRRWRYIFSSKLYIFHPKPYFSGQRSLIFRIDRIFWRTYFLEQSSAKHWQFLSCLKFKKTANVWKTKWTKRCPKFFSLLFFQKFQGILEKKCQCLDCQCLKLEILENFTIFFDRSYPEY